MKSKFVLLAITTALAHGAAMAAAQSGTHRDPNILVILADDMGFNDIEPFGQSIIKTPTLKALANEGMRFTNFHVHAACAPTRAQMLTGVDNHLAGMGAMGKYHTPEMEKYPGNYIGAMNDRVKTFAEVLKDRGYATFMSGKWHLGGKDEYLPPAKGFEKSFVLLDGGGSHWDGRGLLALAPKSRFMEDGKHVDRATGEFSSDLYTDKFLSYMKEAQAAGKPFLGYLAFQAVHDPLHAPADYIKKYRGKFADGYDKHRQELFANMKRLGVIPAGTKMGDPALLFKPWAELSAEERKEQERLMEIYAGMLDNLDANIGRVVAELKRSGAYDNTVIFFFSDNGPSAAYMGLYPGNADGKWIQKEFDTSFDNLGAPKSFAGLGPGWAYASSAPFKLFKMFLTEGGTISPLIVKAPMVKKPGSLNDSFLAVEDIFPTVLELAKAERGSTRNGVPLEPLKGKSFVHVIDGTAKAARNGNFERGEELFGNKAYRQGKWKISWLPKPYGEERWQLFDTQEDRGETQDLAAQHPELVAAMVSKYGKWAQENKVVNWDYQNLANLFDYFDWRKGIPKQIVDRD
ncbi:arylsulfatase [Ralstonia sp. GX3-BWBA]|uniref:arylsulfatase n=1 Tax=Ralstonia sp. GX3-BWBA TaxID=2219865 RepID=UPI001EF8F253|nr:arylsulfatase [Ralstonia sp. GX3-BWBA]